MPCDESFPTLQYKGNCYATLNGLDPSDISGGYISQYTYEQIPDGWEIANASEVVYDVANQHGWGTAALVFNPPGGGLGCASTLMWDVGHRGCQWTYIEQNNTYKPDGGNLAILIVKSDHCEFAVYDHADSDGAAASNGWTIMYYEDFQDQSIYKQLFIDYHTAHNYTLKAISSWSPSNWAMTYGESTMNDMIRVDGQGWITSVIVGGNNWGQPIIGGEDYELLVTGSGNPLMFSLSTVFTKFTCCEVTDLTKNPAIYRRCSFTQRPTSAPTIDPTGDPTQDPTDDPTQNPTSQPSSNPTPGNPCECYPYTLCWDTSWAVFKNGLYWAWASPCSGGCSQLPDPLPYGWRRATNEEFAAGYPSYDEFGQGSICAASVFDPSHNHCDANNYQSGLVTNVDNGGSWETVIVHEACSGQPYILI